MELKSAILKIGLDQIHEIILRLRVHRLFECKKGTVSIENLLKHSLGVACLSKKIAEFIKFEKKWAKVAFSLGLLHDIGKIGRYRIDEIEDSSTLERDSRFAVKESISLIEVERLNNSPLHDYLGYIICKSCGYLPFAEEVTLWHHQSDACLRTGVSDDLAHKFVDLVIVANWLVHKYNYGFSGHKSIKRPPDSLFTRIGLSQNHIEELVDSAHLHLQKTSQINEFLF